MKVLNHLKQNEKTALSQLLELLRIPSISAQSEYTAEVRRCAQWVAHFLGELGFKVDILEPGGHPIVFAEYHRPENERTVLIYGHYDVQPVDPLDLWHSPPFEPVVRDGYIVGRGAVDNKGQFFAHLKAAEAWIKTAGALPINVKFLIEGEEESVSSKIDQFVAAHPNLLKADLAVISDGLQFAPDMPAITYGLRGFASADITVTGPAQDLHSGSYGGAVANPIHVLADLIARLHDKNGRVAVPGFYKRVYKPGEWEREQMDRLPFDPENFRAGAGVPELYGEPGCSPLEQTWSRPTLEVNGIWGGYQGEGVKTIIPAHASAKITMRLVPEMIPEETCHQLEAYVRKICPQTVKLTITTAAGGKPYLMKPGSRWLEAARNAVSTGFDREPFFIKEGGSIPVVEIFQSVLGLDTLLIGLGQVTDNAHSPNERFLIADFHRGCRMAAALLAELAASS